MVARHSKRIDDAVARQDETAEESLAKVRLGGGQSVPVEDVRLDAAIVIPGTLPIGGVESTCVAKFHRSTFIFKNFDSPTF